MMSTKIILVHGRQPCCLRYEFLQAAKPLIAMAKSGLAEATVTASACRNFSINAIRHTYADNGIPNCIDLKMLDIKSVLLQAVDNVLSRGPVGMLTVSCLNEDEALAGVAERCRKSKTLAIGVTVLTTMKNEQCYARFGAFPQKSALRLGKLAKAFGFNGITCSAHELRYLQDAGLLDETFISVVPGNRPLWATYIEEGGRTATPEQIAKWGANYTVVGRAVNENSNPLEALRRICGEMASAA